MKTIIICALRAEATPFKEHYQLRRKPLAGHMELYHGDQVDLVVSGIGQAAAAAAVGLAIAMNPLDQLAGLFNFGFASAHLLEDTPIGSLRRVDRAVNTATGYSFVPDLLDNGVLPEATAFTVPKPWSYQPGNPPIPPGIVEMEAASFFEAGSAFLGPHQLASVKMISDFDLRNGPLNLSQLKTHLIDCADKVFATLDRFSRFLMAASDHSRLLDAMVASCAAALRLGQTQTHRLRTLANRHFADQKKPAWPEEILRLLETPVENKQQRNTRFEQICKQLT